MSTAETQTEEPETDDSTEPDSGPVFQAEIAAQKLADAIETLQAVAQEAVFQFNEDGIYTSQVDPANIAMVNQTISTDAFAEYLLASEFKLGLDLNRFDDYVSKADEELVTLSFDLETRMVSIESGVMNAKMAAIDADSVRDGPDIEDTLFDEEVQTTDVSMEGAAFSHAVDVCSMASDALTMDSDPDRNSPVQFVAEGDTDEVSIEFGQSLTEGSTVDEASESIYSIEYLEELSSAIPKTAELRVISGQERPLILMYDTLDSTASVSMGLAPRISDH